MSKKKSNHNDEKPEALPQPKPKMKKEEDQSPAPVKTGDAILDNAFSFYHGGTAAVKKALKNILDEAKQEDNQNDSTENFHP